MQSIKRFVGEVVGLVPVGHLARDAVVDHERLVSLRLEGALLEVSVCDSIPDDLLLLVVEHLILV